MSDPIEEVYEKYFRPRTELDIEEKIVCPLCGSETVDRRAGYRGEYRCTNCGHFWQVGGRYAT